jgi:hypothetical protein
MMFMSDAGLPVQASLYLVLSVALLRLACGTHAEILVLIVIIVFKTCVRPCGLSQALAIFLPDAL